MQPNWIALKTTALSLVVLVLTGQGCRKQAPEVVVYTALDREFSLPLLQEFEAQTGIRVRTKFDTESTKSVGLTSQIIAESKGRTRCDVFWNNEILNTIRLDQRNLLRETQPKHLAEFPAEYYSENRHWFGFAARARILIVNTELVANEFLPDSIFDLLDEKWKGKIGMAKPLFGTTASHAACLFEALGDERARALFEGLKANGIQIVSGNKQVAQDVASGRLAIGLTDTDDAMIEMENGHPVRIVYPDASADQLGTLFIPNTLSLLREAPHPEAGEALINFLLSGHVEQHLAEGSSAQIPLSKSGAERMAGKLRVETPLTIQPMLVDFEASAERWEQVAEFLKNEFLAR